MALASSLIITFLISSHYALAESKLPVLETKQDIANIRYLSNDGNVTYYQRKSGSLLLSTNYKVKEVLKAPPNTEYSIISSPSKRYIIATKNESYDQYFNLRASQELYLIKFGAYTPASLGKGLSPQLHLNDTWLSFYDPYTKLVHFKKTDNQTINFSIRSANKNPYFIPHVLFIDNNTVIYLDLNKQGVPGLVQYKLNSKEIFILQKFSSPNLKIEICLKNNSIITGEFALDPLEGGAKITSRQISDLTPDGISTLYESPKTDIGNIQCNLPDNNIYFIQRIFKGQAQDYYEAVQLDLTTKNIKVLSDLKFTTQLVTMDDKLLTPYNGKHYVLKGKSDMTQFDLLQPKKDKKQ
jgi:hypothetical protein